MGALDAFRKIQEDLKAKKEIPIDVDIGGRTNTIPPLLQAKKKAAREGS